MEDEQWAMIPRKKRPEPEDLDGYEREYEFDPDYSQYRRERADWMHDYFRREEEDRERKDTGRVPLAGHGDEGNRHGAGNDGGFDRESFNLDKVLQIVEHRPQH